MFRGAPSSAELAQHVVTHDESVDSLPKIVCGYADIKMKGDTTPMRVLVVDSSAGYGGLMMMMTLGGAVCPVRYKTDDSC